MKKIILATFLTASVRCFSADASFTDSFVTIPSNANQVDVCVDVEAGFDSYPASLSLLAVEKNNTTNNHQFSLDLAAEQSDACTSLSLTDIPDASTIIISVIETDSIEFSQGSIMQVFQSSLNVAPNLSLSASQAGVVTKNFIQNQGDIQISVEVSDLEGDSVILDWSGSDSVLIDTDSDVNNASMTIDPTSLDVGVYTVKVGAVQTGSLALPTIVELAFRISEEGALELDSDLDGITDDNELSVLANELSFSDSTASLLTPLGTRAVLGDISFSAGIERLVVDYELFEQWVDSSVSNFANIEQVINFSIEGIGIRGAQSLAVIKLDAPLSSDKTYYKFRNGFWAGFSFNEGDNYFSALSDSEGVCPEALETNYSEGMLQGNDCILLKITDGGLNDYDGIANGVIKDPGGIANRSTSSSSSSDDDGDTVPKMSPGSLNVLTLLLLLGLLGYRSYAEK